MQLPLVFTQTLLLVGHAPLTDREVAFIQTWQGPIVCADGGLQYVQQTEDVWVIGDGDSYVDHVAKQSNFVFVPEQDSNDLEKCLTRIKAPKIIGIGFLGGRWDHSLANLSLLLNYQNVILTDATQSIVGCHNTYQGRHIRQEILGIIPANHCSFTASHGLQYPLDGLNLAMGARISSSNACVAEDVSITGKGQFWFISNSILSTKIE
jgi:thiamine pyrophosphokinase